MVVWNRDVVVIGPVVVLIEQVDRGVDERRLCERATRIDSLSLRVVVPHDCSCSGGDRVAHRCAAHVLVLLVDGVTPSIVLERSVLGIRGAVVSLLVQIGVSRQHPCSWRNHIWLDSSVVRRAAARERSELLRVSSARIRGDRRRRIVVWPCGTIREEIVLARTTVSDS